MGNLQKFHSLSKENRVKQRFLEHIAECKKVVDCRLEELFNGESLLDNIFLYSAADGGKRFRAALILAFATGENALFLKAAIAMESIHAFSLIHDDMPMMDNDDFRRGKPSCHKKFGEAQALLAGDGLLARAMILASQLNLQVVNELSQATYKMIEGQFLEFSAKNPTIEELRQIHDLKTGALIQASIKIGAILAGKEREELAALARYGAILGELFQLTDDILDIDEESPFNMAKRLGTDAAHKRVIELGAEAMELIPESQEMEILRGAIEYLVDRVTVHNI